MASNCSTDKKNENLDLKTHWELVYLNKPNEQLGWYETDLTPTLKLLEKTQLPKSASILNIGAGNTTFIDELLKLKYHQIIATDISETALTKLNRRLNSKDVTYITDDLTKPTKLINLSPIDLWIDRAVLHFFTTNKQQNTYFELLKSKVKKQGFVILAQFNLQGAEKCSGLPVKRYDAKLLKEKLGSDFKLIDSFDYNYIMPSGNKRPYIYTLFKRVN